MTGANSGDSGLAGGAIGRVKIRGVNLAVEWVGEGIERERERLDGRERDEEDGGLLAAYRHRGLTNERTDGRPRSKIVYTATPP